MKPIKLLLLSIILSLGMKAQTPIAFYPFTGNANDAVGTNHGTVNGATLTTDRFSNANRAYSFDGVNDYIEVTDNNLIDLSTNFTISVWIFPTANSAIGTIINKEYSYEISRHPDGTIQYALSANGTGSDWAWVNTNLVAPLNTWSYITFVKTGSNVQVYLNAVNGHTNSAQPATLASNTSNLRIGERTFTSEVFPGKLDDIKIYNTALSAVQVLNEYNTSSNNLVAYYPFTGNANDTIGSNNGTVNGATLTTDRFGNANSAYSFDGVDDFVGIGSLNFATNDYTISYWVNVNATTTDMVVVSGNDPAALNQTFIMSGFSSGVGRFLHRNPSGTSGGVNLAGIQSLTLGQWKFVTCVKQGTTLTSYVNGVLDNTITDAAATNINSAIFLEIGRLMNGSFTPIYHLNGKIDEVKIYNTSLTAAQVLAEYNATSNNGLVAYYSFNGNANDVIGTKHGTVNGATLTTDRFGNANSAYSFDGVDDVIELNHAFNGFTELTISAWVKINGANQANDWQSILSSDASGKFTHIQALVGTSSNCAVYVDNNSAVLIDHPAPVLNTWYHITLVAKSGESKMYINGLVVDSKINIFSFISNTNLLRIGSGYQNGRFLNGSIDEVKIYNTALSSTQVQQEYTSTANNLIAYYKFNNNPADSSGNNLHATIIGSPSFTTDRNGNANSAISFNGNVANRLEVDDHILLHTPSITIASWVKLNSLGGILTILDKPMGTSFTDSWHCGTENSNFSTWHFNSATNQNPFSQVTTPASTGQWYYVVNTFDNVTKQHKLYIDGVLKTSITFNSTIGYDNSKMYIGAAIENGGLNYPMNGILDDIKIYDGALSASQILNEYKTDFALNKPGSGQAISLDGVNDYVQLPPVLDGATQFTVDFWIKTTENRSHSTYWQKPSILGNGNPSGPDGDFGISTSNGFIGLWHGFCCGDQSFQTTKSINDNLWHHVAAVNDGTTMVLYVDGVLLAGSVPTGGGALQNAVRPWRLGMINSCCSGDTPHQGSLDEFRLWNVALTQAQIRERMCKKITTTDVLYNNLSAYYNFDEDLGSTVFDLSVNGNMATLNNGATRETSGAAIGNTSAFSYAGPTASVNLAHPTRGDDITVTLASGASEGLQVYHVQEAPNTRNGIQGLETNDGYFGTFVVGGSSPSLNTIYNYDGISNISDENALSLFSRNNNSTTTWTGELATLNSLSNTLTKNGINASQKEFIIGANDPGNISTDQSSCLAFIPNPLIGTTAFNGAAGVTYQWQDSLVGGTWQNISGATNASPLVLPIATSTTYYRRIATSGSLTLSSNIVLIDSKGAISPSILPNNQWNLYAYDGTSVDSIGVSYKGSYSRTTLGINTITDYGSGINPSLASGYQGCSLNAINNTYSLYAKRKGFPTGNYALNIPQHDDEIKIFKDGMLLTSAGCCNNMGSQYFTLTTLDANSVIECRMTNSGGGPGHMVVDIFLQNLTGGTISANQSNCAAFTPAQLNNVHPAYGGSSTNISYQWQESNDNINFSDLSGATALTYQPNLVSQDKYFRRKASNPQGEIAFSNVVFMDINGPIFFADNDGDGYGDPSNTINACSLPMGYVNNNQDCDDNDSLEHPGQIWYLDGDGDGYATGSPMTQCNRPSNRYVAPELIALSGDCNDNHNHVHPGAQYLTFSGSPNYTNQIVYPLQGDAFTNFTYEVMYFNIYNELPENGAPRLSVDLGQNFILDANDKRLSMVADDANDLNTQDGKKYILTVNGIQPGIPIQSYVSPNLINCDYFGPFMNTPQVLSYPNVSILAKDITFSNYTPGVSSPLTVTAMVTNESDFDATNFSLKLVNQFDTTIVYPLNTLSLVPAHGTASVSWNITTPAISGLCPMKVFVDAGNVIAETNENDNTAIRGFANGGGSSQGGIVVTSHVTPSTAYVVLGSMAPTLNIVGQATYTGLAIPMPDIYVQGAEVICTLVETGQQFSGTTDGQGNFNIPFIAPVGLGSYHISGSVFDFTWTGSIDPNANTFTILPAPIAPEILSAVTVTSTTPMLEGGALAGHFTVHNAGDADALSPFKSRLLITGPAGLVYQDSIELSSLAAHTNSGAIPFSIPSLTQSGTYFITVIVDENNSIVEGYEGDNNLTISIQVVPTSVDINVTSVNTNSTICTSDVPVGVIISNTGSVHCGASQAVLRLKKNGITLDTVVVQVPALNAGQGYSVNHTFHPPFLPSNYVLEVATDQLGILSESDETNNFSSTNFSVDTCKPDLHLATDCGVTDLIAVNNNYAGPVTLKAVIQNNGDRNLTNPVVVRFDFMNGTFFNQTYNGGLTLNQQATVLLTIPSIPSGATQFKVIVDPDQTVEEKNETNNESNPKQLGWDFSPSEAGCTTPISQFNYHTGGFFHFYSSVRSNNMFGRDSVLVNFKISGPGIIGLQNMGDAIIYNTTQTCVCPQVATLPSVFLISLQGTYHIFVTTDPYNDIPETDENNNVMELVITVADKPDMRLLSNYINPSNLNPIAGQSITTQVTYDNIAYGNLNDQMKLKLFIDNIVVDSISNATGLVQDGKMTYTFNTPWSSIQPGVHLVKAMIDADNVINEVNENNNIAMRPIIVGDAANMHFDSLTANILYPSLNDSITILATIGNNGTLNCSSVVNFYFTNNLNDTIAFKSIPVTVNGNSTKAISFKWKVLDEQTNILAVISNSSAQEFDYTDNDSSFQIGKMAIVFESTPACNTGTLFAGVLGGKPPFNYQWNNGASGNLMSDTAGTYTVTVSDATGLTTSDVGTIADCMANINIHVFLQGFYQGGGFMTDVLFQQGRVNLHTHTDTVEVALHDATTLNMISSYRGLLKTDGSLQAYFPTSFVGGSYYIVLKHRNSIESWSATPITLGLSNSYDFTSAASSMFGDNATELESGIFGIYCGDITHDGSVDAFDYLVMDPMIVNGDSGYLDTDINGDGVVDAFDFLMIEANLTNGVGSFTP